MKRAIALLLGCVACSEARELVLEVDAESSLAGIVDRARVRILDGETELDAHELDTTGAKPDCFPFSLSIVPREGNEDAPFTVSVSVEPSGSARIERRIETRFQPGLRLLRVTLPGEIEDPVEVDRGLLEQRIAETPCRTPEQLGPLQCLAKNGCYGESDRLCTSPCPDPGEPVPPMPPDPPAPPAPPNLGPCPPGWTASGDPAFCEPWTSIPDCPSGQARFPSNSACTTIGPPCPMGQYAEITPGGMRLFVDPGAAPGGDGLTEATALRTPAEAIALASAGTQILLSKTTHAGPAVIDRAIELIGACAAETLIDAELEVTAGGATVRNLRARGLRSNSAVELRGVELDTAGLTALEGASVGALDLVVRATGGYGIHAARDAVVTATRALVDQATLRAAFSEGGTIELTDAALLRTRSNGSNGVALAAAGGSVFARDSIFEDAVGFGVLVEADGTAVLERSIIRGVTSAEDLTFGTGLRVARGTARFSKLYITSVLHAGIYANSRSRVSGTDLLIRDVSLEAAGGNGHGLLSSSGSTIAASRVWIDQASRTAINIEAHGELYDVVVRDTRPGNPDGIALLANRGGRAVIERARFERHPAGSIVAFDRGSSATVRDLHIPPPGTGAQGEGVVVHPGARVKLERAIIESARYAGIYALLAPDDHAVLELSHLTVRDTRPLGDGAYGLLIGGDTLDTFDQHRPAMLTLSRAVFQRNRKAGIGLARAEAELSDVLVEDTGEGSGTKQGGVGIVITLGARLIGRNIHLRRNVEAGLSAGLIAGNSELPSRAEISDLAIEGTTCPEDQGCTFFRGSGAGTLLTGELSFRRFHIHDNRTAGIFQYYHGPIELFEGRISGEETGVQLSERDFDVASLIRGVDFSNNRIDVAIDDTSN